MTRLWVEGEISNLSRPASGHIYLSLKDDSAQISAAWFRQRQRAPAIGFKNGDRVLAFGRVSLYEARGNYQLIIEELEPAGEGVLKRRFDALKFKLANEGLFDEDRKQALPSLPTRIGIITSASGAAVSDVLSILGRRFPAVPVVIYPAAVQGDAAPGELLSALSIAVRRNECDVLILCRGGGSIEDLWAFNDEILARAISDCALPIISAVGHEIDFTIADFVADMRAPTPSVAAEIVVPNQDDWLRQISGIAIRIARVGRRALEDTAQELDWLGRRLVASSPAATLQRQRQSLREQGGRLNSAMRQQLLEQKSKLQSVTSELMALSPALSVQQSIANLQRLRQRLTASVQNPISDANHKIALLGRALNSVSPLATLDRGYAIVKASDSDKVLLSTSEMKAGDDIRAHLSRGEFVATVKKVIRDD